ncbi:MAG: heparinase II/III family protein [Armatimonadota bacterium]|nr:heparinase II/III family protein [Armatimonadota bacterium]
MRRMSRIPSVLAAFALSLAASSVCAGPPLDQILNYMFMDQSVPMKGPQLLFDVQKQIPLTKDSPIGQTFMTGPETTQVARVRAYLGPTGDWEQGEGAELTVWDSPEKKVKLGSDIVWYENRDFHYKQVEWDVKAPVKPNSAYYFEMTYAGSGDGQMGRVGLMDKTDAYPPGRGYLAGQPRDYDLCFQTHSRRAPDPIGNLKKMFARLDMDRPGLEEVKQAVEKDDFETAIAKTVQCFEARQEPSAIIRPEDVVNVNPEADTAEADSNMNATWRQVDMVGYGGRKLFLNAYQATGDEKYAKKLNDLLIEWYINSPPPSESRIGGCPWDDMWASLSAGLRLGHGFVAYSRMHTARSFTTDCRLAYIFSLADHCNTLVKYGGDAGGNWSFTQNSSMLTFSMNFPEFKESEVWRKTATDRLMEAIKKDILPDGVETESAPSYQRMAYNPLAGVFDDLILRRGLRTPFAADLSNILERQAEYFMYFPMPNGVTPWLGDWGHENDRGGVLKDAERFNRDDMRFVATAGKKGKKPKELSKLYPYAGVVTLRSDWGDAGRPFDDARYLLIHGVHYGAHGHQDINGISGLYAYGRELLTDPGSHEYGSPEHFKLTTGPSHNLMTIDGEDQNRRGETAFRNWSTTPVADYLSSYAAAYKGGDYTREVVFARANGTPGIRDYWIVRDTAAGSGNHSLEQRWRFVLDTPMQVNTQSLTTRTAYDTGGNLAILQVDPSRLKVEETTTDTWGARAKTSEPPTKLPTVVYSANTLLPAVIDTVLLPFEGKRPPSFRVTSLEKSPNGLESAFKITQGHVEDLFVFKKAPGKKYLASEKVGFDGERIFVRRVNGKLRSVLLVNGAGLTVAGKQIIKSPKRLSWVAVSLDPTGTKAYASSEAPGLAIGAGGAKVSVRIMNTDRLLRPVQAEAGKTLLTR